MKRKIIEPVTPVAMDIVLTYECPSCNVPVTMIAPVFAAKIRCQHCGLEFPLIPADATTIQYLRLMFANGKAVIHPDYL